MSHWKKLSALLLSAALLTGLSGGALAAETKTETQQEDPSVTLLVTSGMDGRCFSYDPFTRQPVDGSYLQAATVLDAQRAKAENTLVVDVGDLVWDTALSTSDDGEERTLPMAQCLRAAGYDAVLPAPGSEEVQASYFAQLQSADSSLTATSVAAIHAADESAAGRPYFVKSFQLKDRSFTVGVLNLGAQDTDEDDFVPDLEPLLRSTEHCDAVAVFRRADDGTASLTVEGQAVPLADLSVSAAVLTLNSAGTVQVKSGEPLSVKTAAVSERLSDVMQPYYQRALSDASYPINYLTGTWDRSQDPAAGSTDAYDLAHKAQLWAAKADVSLLPTLKGWYPSLSSLHTTGQGSAFITSSDLLSLYGSFSYAPVLVEMTGKQLKAQLLPDADGTVTSAYGVSYQIYTGDPAGVQVCNVLYQGKPLADDQKLKVALSPALLSRFQDSLGTRTKQGAQAADPVPVLWNAAESEEYALMGGSLAQITAAYAADLGSENKKLVPERDTSFTVLAETVPDAYRQTVSRLTFIETLYAVAGSPEPASSAPVFSDVTDSPALNWAVECGLASGNGSGAFDPDGFLTREQTMIFLLRFDVARGVGPKGAWAVPVPYTDAIDVSTWAADAVMWNVIQGYLPADAEGDIDPQSSLTGAELAAIIATMQAQLTATEK